MGITNAAIPATKGFTPLNADIIFPIPYDTTAKTAAMSIEDTA